MLQLDRRIGSSTSLGLGSEKVPDNRLYSSSGRRSAQDLWSRSLVWFIVVGTLHFSLTLTMPRFNVGNLSKPHGSNPVSHATEISLEETISLAVNKINHNMIIRKSPPPRGPIRPVPAPRCNDKLG